MSNEYQFTGTVMELSPLTEDRGYHHRSVVVGSGGRYPTQLQVRFSDKSGDTAAKLDGVNVGDRVTVTFEVSSRKGTGGDKWFTNANGWECDVISRRNRPAAQRPAPEDGPPPPDDSDLPF